MRQLTRREFVNRLGLASAGLLVAACSSAAPAASTPAAVAPATTAPASTAPQATWDALVAAAKQEGKVVVETPVGPGYREAIDVFVKAFPGIEAEHQPFPDSATFVPKLEGERK